MRLAIQPRGLKIMPTASSPRESGLQNDDLSKLSDSELARRGTPACDAFLTLRLHRALLGYLSKEDEALTKHAARLQADAIAGLLEKHRDDWSAGLQTLARNQELDKLTVLCSEEGDERMIHVIQAYLYQRLPRVFPTVSITTVEDAIQEAMMERFVPSGRGQTIRYLCKNPEKELACRVIGLVFWKAERIVYEQFRGHLRRDSRMVSLDVPPEDDSPALQPEDPSPNALADIIRAEEIKNKRELLAKVLKALRVCFDKLHPSYQSALLLVAFGFTRTEIADAFEETVGASDTRQYNARNRLRGCFEEALRRQKDEQSS